ncbi:restriction endonuclease subunit S [Vibrio breoganii]|uniref:restriction endonuclease subunit S n=2 Tax=Vibrio breoganii TaxID=553239 RepID=UPI00030BB84E|nr:restriction endonuclease subunit S [Vibrio breoganii]
MTGRYQAYSEYKDSGVDWLGKIPSHWEVTKTAWHFTAEKGKNGQLLTNEYIGQNEGDYPVYSGQTGNNGVMGSIDSYEFDTGKEGVLFSTTVGAKAMTLNHLKGKFSLSQNCLIIQNKSPIFNTRFCFYHFQPLFSFERGLIPEHMQASFRMEDLYQYKVASPSFSEQQKIANFLDHEAAKTDTLITKQEKLIELLKEKRQAVISHAVTKGLNPEAPMKDSGVEWLGDVPEHWRVSQLKHHVDTVNGFGFSSSDFQEEGVPFIRAGNIKNKTIVKPDIHLPHEVVDKYRRVILNDGELVISMVGSDPKIKASAVGQVGLVPSSLAGSVPNQNVVILREQSSLLKKFLFYVVCGTPYRHHLDVFSHKLANQSIISSSLIISAQFTFPEIDEQRDIIGFLDAQLSKYDKLVVNATRSIELMKERKTALISAAVTGKIDVREWKSEEVQG